MEALYDRVLDLLRRLRVAGRAEDADALLAALTQACNQREILSELRYSVSDLMEEGLDADLVEAKRALLTELEVKWRELH
ncbi:MAG TPA: hypothetical protein VNV60_11470 [Holophagaceae bacterium]|jgi:hypothetical protein|nr:hypothetical protein [Holophagaceae bacterium]